MARHDGGSAPEIALRWLCPVLRNHAGCSGSDPHPYGGYAGVILAGGAFGASVSATLLVRTLIVSGMALSAMGWAHSLRIGGAAAAVGALCSRVRPMRSRQPRSLTRHTIATRLSATHGIYVQ